MGKTKFYMLSLVSLLVAEPTLASNDFFREAFYFSMQDSQECIVFEDDLNFELEQETEKSLSVDLEFQSTDFEKYLEESLNRNDLFMSLESPNSNAYLSDEEESSGDTDFSSTEISDSLLNNTKKRERSDTEDAYQKLLERKYAIPEEMLFGCTKRAGVEQVLIEHQLKKFCGIQSQLDKQS